MKTKLFNLMALFFVAAITLSFTACGDDDDNGSVNKSQLIGKWKIVKTEIYDLNGYLIKELNMTIVALVYLKQMVRIAGMMVCFLKQVPGRSVATSSFFMVMKFIV